MRRLAASLQSAREEERADLARELHDDLGQTLTAIKLELGRTVDALKGVAPRPCPSWIDCSRSSVLSTSASRWSSASPRSCGRRRSIIWVWPRRFGGRRRRFSARSGLRCHVVAGKETGTALTAEQQTALFRIFQEALTNVVRHAHASAVRVRLTEARGAFELRVSDNGRGITRAEIADAGSIGLLGMRERALQAGAMLEIAGVPGKGTVVTVSVPLPLQDGGGSRARRAAGKVKSRQGSAR